MNKDQEILEYLKGVLSVEQELMLEDNMVVFFTTDDGCYSLDKNHSICGNIWNNLSFGHEIDTQHFGQYVSLADLPPVDLLIRTGGDFRLSNFLLWQAAYAELYFTQTLWPEFCIEEFDDALAVFGGRERRFGKTSEQIQQEKIEN